MTTRALNLGCGTKIIKAGFGGFDTWVNLDQRDLPGVDCVRDLRRGLPYDDASFDYVLMDNVLEHLASEDAIFIINEIDRVLVDRGVAVIIVPHADSQGAKQDPTHKSFWVPRSFMYWSNRYTSAGGRTIGITADFSIAGVEIRGDMQTEAFVTATLVKGETEKLK